MRVNYPTGAIMLLTHKCDLECMHCLNNWKNCTKRQFEQKERTLKDITPVQKFRAIKELRQLGTEHISFSGGEPLLDPNCATYIRYAKALGFRTELQTNGVYLTEAFLLSVQGSLDRVTVSLHGTKRPHNRLTRSNSFDTAVNAVKLAKKEKIAVSTFLVLNKFNFKILDKYIHLVNRLGVDTAYFTRLYHSGSAIRNIRKIHLSKEDYLEAIKVIDNMNKQIIRKDIPSLAKLHSRQKPTTLMLRGSPPLCLLRNHNINLLNLQCGAAKMELAINPNGDVLPCPSWPKPIGNLTKDSIINIWNKTEMINCANNSIAPETCNSCELGNACNKGCQVCMPNGLDEFADLTKTSISKQSLEETIINLNSIKHQLRTNQSNNNYYYPTRKEQEATFK